MKRKVSARMRAYTAAIIDDGKRDRLLSQSVYIAFSFIADFMSIINIITARYTLFAVTATFSVLCLINYFLARRGKKSLSLASYLFMIEIIVMFSYFIITGGTDNFSIVWLLLLPTLGLFFFGIKKGTIVSGIILVIMLLFFHCPPFKQYCTDYGNTFRTRFPMVYICSFLVSLLLEAVRNYMSRELAIARNKYEYLYSHDALTGVNNRYNFYDSFIKTCDTSTGSIGVLFFDIDNFKIFNDKYGHLCGDTVLKETCSIVSKSLSEHDSMYRWGGEEFVILISDGRLTNEKAEKIRKSVEKNVFSLNGITTNITISLGGVTARVDNYSESQVSVLLKCADENLYKAKNEGRNRVVCSEL